MFTSYSHFIFVLLLSLFGLATCLMRGNETDRIALLQFKSMISEDPFKVFDSWNDTLHFCDWQGVTCSMSQEEKRVTGLDLQSFKLSGFISPNIGNLSFLRELNLTDNKLTREIPAEIGHLSRLETLTLNNNSLQGVIPRSLFNCTGLVVIRLARNRLVGEIPWELGTLSKLEMLAVSNNLLTGQIPSSIGNLSALHALNVAVNYLHGSIPESFGHLKNMATLGLGGNNFSGTIPRSIFNVSTLTIFDLTDSKGISRSLPSDLFNTLPNLRQIGLGGNLISGSIPLSISNATNLVRFGITGGQLSGSVPSLSRLSKLRALLIANNYLGTKGDNDLDFMSSLANASGLYRIDISDNYVGGRLPKTISNLSNSLGYLNLGNNYIMGNIPSSIGELVNLGFLGLYDNFIDGLIPSSLGKLGKLGMLFLDSNKLTGELTSSVGNLTQLIKLNLGDNFLQGRIPSSLGKLQYINSMSLYANNFSGSIPGEVFSLQTLSITLDLSGNKLVGSLPTEIVHLKNLVTIDVSNNMLHGHLPDNLGACVGLEFLYMEGNNFQGSIPSTLSSLKSLTDLDLSRNNLSGEIPRFLEGLNMLQYLNLSYNNLEGEVPSGGVFKDTSAAFVEGNGKLCGGSAKLHLPGCPSPKGYPKLTLKLAISITCALFVAFLVALFLFFCKFKRKPGDLSLSCSDDPSFLVLSYHSLAKATGGFSQANLLGVGAFGSVYKGTIGEGEDRTIVAVKVLNLCKRGAEKSFLAECKALRNIRHRNLVKVLTACSGIDSERNDFKALIYEYMPNGSLENWLHPDLEGGVTTHGTRGHLSLVQRLNIAIDVGYAIEYLHHQCASPIVHCDLKPSNILLDAEVIAHVGDFGLARFIPQANHPATQSSSVGIRGSTGYAAPEYGMGSKASTSGDVYSYGILLLELFTGKRPTDEMFNDSLNLHNFAKKALTGHVNEIADPPLLDEGIHTDLSMKYNNQDWTDDKRRNRAEECLLSVYRVGVACSNENPKERMAIADAVAELSLIKSRLVVPSLESLLTSPSVCKTSM